MLPKFARVTVMAFAVAAACSDVSSPPTGDDASAPQYGIGSGQVQDVPAVTIDLPPAPRAWDTSAVALERVIADEDGHAIVAFKAPASARALVSGRREAVPAEVVAQALDLLADRGISVITYYAFMGAAHVQLPPGAGTELGENDLTDYIEPRQWRSVQGVAAPVEAFDATSALRGQTIPWGIELVGAPEAWDSATGACAAIEVIDTGHDRGHEDLPLVPLKNCAGAYGGCNDAFPYPHGSHVLGIFTARDNSLGVVGVAPGVGAWDVYVYGACNSHTGLCSTTEIVKGIQRSWDWDVDVLNMSFGSTDYDQAEANAVAQAWSENVVLVAAAGNRRDGQQPPADIYPAGAGLEPADQRKVRWADLVALIKDDYVARRNRSTKRLEYALDHLEAFFGDFRAVNVTPDAIRTYQRQRQGVGAAAGTVNREVSYLRRMLRLAHRYGRLRGVPYVPILEEPTARDVTLESEGELTALIEALPEHHRGWVALAACTGWRKRAILTRMWAHIRTDASGQRWLHLDRGSSKNKEPYRYPVVGDVACILDAQRDYVDRVERRTAQVVRWMFPYADGRPIRFPDNAFKNAAKAAGRPELHVHDLRRFAASRMAELGVPETDAMELLGMETRSIFTRYDISNGARKVRAVERLAGALDAEPKKREVAGLRVRHG